MTEENRTEIVPVSISFELGNLVDNLPDVEASIQTFCDGYMSMVITEENLKDGTEALANIRRVKKSIDDERKSIKRQWNAPYEAWEAKLKDGIFAICDTAIDSISKKMQEYEDERIAKRQEIICRLYDQAINDMPDAAGYIDIEYIRNIPTGQKTGARILGDKWLLKTYDIPDIREDIRKIVSDVSKNVQQIIALNSKYVSEALEQYRITKDFSAAVNRIRQMEEQEKRILEQERLRREAEERERERQRILEEDRQKRLLEEEKRKKEEAIELARKMAEEREKAEQEARIAKENAITAPSIDEDDWDYEPEKEYKIMAIVPESVMKQLSSFFSKHGYRFKTMEVSNEH